MISTSFDATGSIPRETSMAAKPVYHEAKVLREKCLALLKERDLTADEVAEMLNKSVLSVRPRISELADLRSVFDSGQRRKNASGKNAIVWTVNKQGSLL